jgi:ParB family chromosome partitioning protein
MSRLADKAKAIQLDAELPSPSAPSPQLQRPRTAMGAISASLAMGRGLEEQNRSLKERVAALEAAPAVQMLDPKSIAPSAWANRHESSFASEDFKRLKDEIAAAGGNVQPIKVRPAKGPRDEVYEIVFGHRRHRACLELGLPVAAIVQRLDDQELFVAMDRENRERADLSPWEQGVMYRRALESGLFASHRKLAERLGVDHSVLSRAVRLASLPDSVVLAFETPLDLQYRWLKPLQDALAQDSEGVSARADRMAKGDRPASAAAVFAALIGPSAAAQEPTAVPIVSGADTVGYVRRSKDGRLSFVVAPGLLTEKAAREVADLIARRAGPVAQK